MALVLIADLAFLPWADTSDDARSIFLFLGILPLVNAITDYLSYVVTMALVDKGRKTAGWAIVMGLADVLAAGVIFVLLGALLVGFVAGANALAGLDLFPLGALFDDLRANPGNCVWL